VITDTNVIAYFGKMNILFYFYFIQCLKCIPQSILGQHKIIFSNLVKYCSYHLY